MKSKIFSVAILVLLYLSSVFGQSGQNFDDNKVSYDTCVVKGFKAGGTAYSKTFRCSPYLDFVLDVLANDTLNGGDTTFYGDSVDFRYLLEYGHMTINGNGSHDTLWDGLNRVLVDTFDMVDADTLNMVAKDRYIDSIGIFNRAFKTVDTLNVTKMAFQSRHIRLNENHDFYRVRFEALTNMCGTAVKLTVGQDRRKYVPVRDR